MKNIKDLRDSLKDNYTKTKSKQMTTDISKQLANTAGKIIKSCQLEMEYNKHMGKKKRIDFLES